LLGDVSLRASFIRGATGRRPDIIAIVRCAFGRAGPISITATRGTFDIGDEAEEDDDRAGDHEGANEEPLQSQTQSPPLKVSVRHTLAAATVGAISRMRRTVVRSMGSSVEPACAVLQAPRIALIAEKHTIRQRLSNLSLARPINVRSETAAPCSALGVRLVLQEWAQDHEGRPAGKEVVTSMI